MEEQKLKLDDKVIYINKSNIKRKQYNFSIQTNIIEEIIKIQQALQLLLDTPVLRGEIIENVLIKGLHAIGEAIIVDNEGYTFSELLNIHEWLENDLIKDFKEQLSTIEGIKKIEKEASNLYRIDELCKQHNLLLEENTELDITDLEDDKLINCFIRVLWNNYILKGNNYYQIKNLKFIESMTILPEIIKSVLYLYNEIENKKNDFNKVKQIIDYSKCQYKSDSEYYGLILKLAINCVSIEKEFKKEIFNEEEWIKSGYIDENIIFITQEYGTDIINISKNQLQN
ncbi:hypothetical protein [Clostridium botulinum]|uniref:hypothetical protein n=1 Tax=Clostridium botulinum TaxID=1491 RepID=UPI000774DC24|nr:hypothetical protein [Clostridium botulinum]NFL38716.1 hypothetical protein [Clostridium botulinum]NFN09686.1 hypothetical protein [Clostridium botulinum]NFN24543.1 hypothetical protein [Clostridium botulinum]NFN31808.1 hypothetical protein [Clostridium botulinum]